MNTYDVDEVSKIDSRDPTNPLCFEFFMDDVSDLNTPMQSAGAHRHTVIRAAPNCHIVRERTFEGEISNDACLVVFERRPRFGLTRYAVLTN